MACVQVPYIPWPRFDRRVLLLLLDDRQRLLVCGSCCHGWTVPQVRLDSGADFSGQATQFLKERFGIDRPRFAALYGVHESPMSKAWELDRQTESRVFIVRVSRRQSALARDAGERHALWGAEELRRRRREISPEGVALLITGFIGGWLPDGPLTLG